MPFNRSKVLIKWFSFGNHTQHTPTVRNFDESFSHSLSVRELVALEVFIIGEPPRQSVPNRFLQRLLQPHLVPFKICSESFKAGPRPNTCSLYSLEEFEKKVFEHPRNWFRMARDRKGPLNTGDSFKDNWDVRYLLQRSVNVGKLRGVGWFHEATSLGWHAFDVRIAKGSLLDGGCLHIARDDWGPSLWYNSSPNTRAGRITRSGSPLKSSESFFVTHGGSQSVNLEETPMSCLSSADETKKHDQNLMIHSLSTTYVTYRSGFGLNSVRRRYS